MRARMCLAIECIFFECKPLTHDRLTNGNPSDILPYVDMKGKDVMGKKLFITGTGTDVGKTFVSGLIVKKLHDAGLSCGYYKAAMSGNVFDEKGCLIPGDAKFVKDLSGIEQNLKSMCPYVYETAVSPHLAAKIEDNPVDMNVVKAGFDKVLEAYDYVTMEGSGGILCPIVKEDKTVWLWEMIKDFDMPTIIVADAGLGTINSVGLTVEFMKNRQIPIKGIIMNHYQKGDVMQEDNIRMCEELTGIKVIAKVCDNASELDIDSEFLSSLYED